MKTSIEKPKKTDKEASEGMLHLEIQLILDSLRKVRNSPGSVRNETFFIFGNCNLFSDRTPS